MNYKTTAYKALHASWLIVKLVIPIYILADILFYYEILGSVSFLIRPLTDLLGLPEASAAAIISGMFLNLYAAVAFAAPLDLSTHQWTVLALFLGICHSLVVEGVVMKKLGIRYRYSYGLRIIAGVVAAWLVSLLPAGLFGPGAGGSLETVVYSNPWDMLQASILEAGILACKIAALICILIFVMEFVKSLPLFAGRKHTVSRGFCLNAGIFLGITYGAGILISESKQLGKADIFAIATFLMIAHAVIEDTLLFVIFGVDFFTVVIIRLVFAAFTAWGMLLWYKRLGPGRAARL